MSFPTIFDWLDRLAFLRGATAAYLVLAAAVLIVVIRDWRVGLLGLLGHYCVAWLLFVEVLDARLAIIKLLTGLFVCLILYVTGRQLADMGMMGRRGGVVSLPLLTNVWMRVGGALLVGLVVWSASQQSSWQLPGMTAGYVALAVYGLVGMGLLQMALTAEPLFAGMGLLMMMTGFELFYHGLEQSVLLLAVLAGGNLLLAVMVAYLAQVKRVGEAVG